MEGARKPPHDQVREIEKLVTDAAQLLDQAIYGLRTVAERLKETDEKGKD